MHKERETMTKEMPIIILKVHCSSAEKVAANFSKFLFDEK